MHSFRRWIYCLLFLIPFPAYSAVTYETVRVAPGVYAPSGATQHDVTVATRRPDGVTRYHNVRPTMPPGTLGRLGRAAVRGGPASVAVVGIIEGLGYLVDQATGDIKKVEIISVPPSSGYIGGTNPASCSNVPNTMPAVKADCQAACSARQYCATEVIVAPDGWVTTSFHGWDCANPTHPYGVQTWPTRNLCYSTSAELIENYIDLDPSDYEVIDTSLANQLSMQQKTDLARRILTMTNSEIATIWPELSALAEAVRQAEQVVYDATLDPVVIPTPEQETIVEDGRFTLPDQQTDSSSDVTVDLELPAFCQWASFICAPFIETEHPPLPTADIDFDDYDSGLPSTAVCPVPLEVVTNFGQWEISFDPACQLAEAIRVPLLAISYLIAGFIVVGVRR